MTPKVVSSSTLGSKGGPPQFVSISKSDIAKNPQLKALDEKTLKTATIDRQVSRYCFRRMEATDEMVL